MRSTQSLEELDRIDGLIEPILRTARIPGAAIAVVAGGENVFAKGYGYRDLGSLKPMTARTVYPVASTTKSINATLLGMLVDDGLLSWDRPVQDYLPRFRLEDSTIGAQATLRDLVTMRTGLPRHDWLWAENPISRADLVSRLQHMPLSCGFRERFQYNNLTVVVAGHVAEVVTGSSWEALVQERILVPLGMRDTGFSLPRVDDVTLAYHENSRRELIVTKRLATELAGPSGGSVHSTVVDMARWISFNLSGAEVDNQRLISPRGLAEIHSPQVMAGNDPSAPTTGAAYALGWFVDTYNGRARLSHPGYLHDVNSEIMLFPEDGIGIVSFINLGGPAYARIISQRAFDLIMGFTPTQPIEAAMTQYEQKIVDTRKRNASVPRVENTSPSHRLDDYLGVYVHPGYGKVEIDRSSAGLMFQRNNLRLALRHHHYDAWVAEDNDLFPIHIAHPFDSAGHFLFETNPTGEVSAVSIRLEPTLLPVRFQKQQALPK
jgi:CubicO group peptidase (beta-lactamase class C family)